MAMVQVIVSRRDIERWAAKTPRVPVRDAAFKMLSKWRRFFLVQMRKAQREVPMAELEHALSLGHPGTGAAEFVLEDTVNAIISLLSEGKLLRSSAPSSLPGLVSTTMQAGGDAAEVCVLETGFTTTRTLSEREANALREYQNGAGINIPLREGRALIDVYAKQVADIDSAMVGNVLANDTTVYRGMNKFFMQDFKEGMEFQDLGFISATTDAKIARGFGNVIEIRMPKGTPALDVSELLGKRSLYDQKEILFGRGLRFRVIKVGEEFALEAF